MANANYTAGSRGHMVLLFLWLVLLFPIGLALYSKYGGDSGCSGRLGRILLLCSAVFGVSGLIAWWSSPVSSALATDEQNSWIRTLALFPETFFCGVMTTSIIVELFCRCLPSPSKVLPRSLAWGLLPVTAVVLQLLAFDNFVGSCGGKIIQWHKKGYDGYGSMSNAFCISHFSYLALAGAAMCVSAAWHYLAESSWGRASASLQPLFSGMEFLFMIVLGTLLVIFRAFTVYGATSGTASHAAGDAFFDNVAGIDDGHVWGRMAAAGLTMLVLGSVGIVCLFRECCAPATRYFVSFVLLVMGCLLFSCGSSPENIFFGVAPHIDNNVAALQCSLLVAAGMVALLASAARLGTVCAAEGGAAAYYAMCVSANCASAFGGFLLLAQPAASQLLSRDLHMDGWGSMLVVLLFVMTIHAAFRIILALILDDAQGPVTTHSIEMSVPRGQRRGSKSGLLSGRSGYAGISTVDDDLVPVDVGSGSEDEGRKVDNTVAYTGDSEV